MRDEIRNIEERIRSYAKQLLDRSNQNKEQAITATYDYKITFESYSEIQQVISTDLLKIIGDKQDD